MSALGTGRKIQDRAFGGALGTKWDDSGPRQASVSQRISRSHWRKVTGGRNFRKEVIPEVALKVAILGRAIGDAIGRTSPAMGRNDKDLIREARRYIFDAAENYHDDSFEAICELLDITPSALRQRVLNLIQTPWQGDKNFITLKGTMQFLEQHLA